MFRLLLSLALLLALPYAARADSLDALDDVLPMDATQLADNCGGFITPDGLNVSIGIDTQTTVNGNLLVNSLNVLNAEGGFTRYQYNGDMTQVAISAGGTQSIITNTANNVQIAQTQVINVNIANFTKTYNPAANGLSALQAQVLTGLRNGIK